MKEFNLSKCKMPLMKKIVKLLKSKSIFAIVLVLTSSLTLPLNNSNAETINVAPITFIQNIFAKKISSPFLRGSGVVVKDVESNEIIYASDSDVLRAPASVLKLISSVVALHILGADTTFPTSIYGTDEPDHFAIVGSSDPWITTSNKEAASDHRALFQNLLKPIIKANPDLTEITLDYYNVYQPQMDALVKYFAPTLTINLNPLSTPKAVAYPDRLMGTIYSPPLINIVKYLLLWSDNILADRLARIGAARAGFGKSNEGLNKVFDLVLTALNVPHAGLKVYDGSGLSKENKVSANTFAELLTRIWQMPNLYPLIDGLPLAGVTGTLKNRFTKDAPAGVARIQAKTGWIANTVSLAGYVTADNRQYAFAIINDRVKNTEKYRALARIAIDRALATLVTQ